MKTILPDFKAVIFDMDGVLVNSEPFYVKIEQQLFEQVGAKVSHEEHFTYQGTATDLMWKKVKERHGLSQSVDELVELSNAIITPYLEELEFIEPIEGVQQLIQNLVGKNIPIALASSSYANVIEIVLSKTGLKKYFRTAVSSQNVLHGKPEPDIFLFAAGKLGVSPEKCIVIEDSTNGIKAAKSAGMFCVAFAGPCTEHQNHSEADLVVNDFKKLLQIIAFSA